MLYQNRTFRIILFSDVLQQLAIWIRNMALLFFVMEQTNGNKVAVSLLSILEYAPILIFSIIGGVLADRWNPKRTMIASDLLSAVSIGIILLMLANDWWEALYVSVFVSAIVSQFSQPSSAKVFKRHIPVDQVPSAIGLSQSMSSLFFILGPIIGTAIYQWAGLTTSLLALPVLFLASAAALALLPKEARPEEQEKVSLKNDLSSGYRFIVAEKGLLRLFLTFAFIGLAAGLVQPLEIFIVTERLGLDKENVQWFAAADGIGLLLGSLLAGLFPKLLKAKYLLPLALAFLGITFLVEGSSIWPLVTGTFRFANGLLLAVFNTAVASFVITKIPDAMVGKVNGLMTPLFTGSILLGTAASGLLAASFGLFVVYALSAVLCLVAVAPSLKVGLQKEAA
ncbi:Predicted arabinose efflux permease, MFS family [Paenibacillus algorifonticola]|uniref:Predicted arabinose efflux permease, MFS family n=2 Tax=Paenibacillus algorifonticola TaxID=684063 RepID=A0A1I2HXP1_9BACL|nr:MFS transporter [Paenibacillus algorifonticola]SFF33517.1 Predicted arabinose efflux permease, MFS family [Paenibacillus algorifonticola]